MRYAPILTLGAVLVLSLSVWLTRENGNAEISVSNGTLYFTGDLSDSSVAAFQAVTAERAPGDIKKIVVNSPGGDTVAGRVIGRWISAHKLDLEVDTICFSSCANYLFPAAVRKSIREGAFVGWHGSETQHDILALSKPGATGADLERMEIEDALKEAAPKQLSAGELNAALDEALESAKRNRREEQQFFASIGLTREFTIHGLRPGQLKRYQASGKSGWTYSLSDMEKLGMKNVHYLGKGRYAEARAVTENVSVIPYNPRLVPTGETSR